MANSSGVASPEPSVGGTERARGAPERRIAEAPRRSDDDAARFGEEAARLCDDAARMPEEGGSWRVRVRAVAHALVVGFKEHDLLTYSSAISFQILTAIIPFALFVLAVTGLFHANGVWRDHLEPQMRMALPHDLFQVIQSGVNEAFSSRRVLWVTLGGCLTVWQVSGAVRAVMGVLGRIYGASGERPFVRRYCISFVLSIEVMVCFIAATLCLLFAPFFFSPAHAGLPLKVVAFMVRWVLVVALLVLVVGLLVRHAPARAQTVPWVTLGAAIVIVLWIVVSLTFYFYLVDVASYASLFGSLAAAIVANAYLYVSTTVFLFGAQLDAIIRTQATGRAAGHAP